VTAKPPREAKSAGCPSPWSPGGVLKCTAPASAAFLGSPEPISLCLKDGVLHSSKAIVTSLIHARGATWCEARLEEAGMRHAGRLLMAIGDIRTGFQR